MSYSHPGCQSPVLRQSFLIASSKLIFLVKTSIANCGALWATIPTVLSLYLVTKSFKKDLTLLLTSSKDSPFGNGSLICSSYTTNFLSPPSKSP